MLTTEQKEKILRSAGVTVPDYPRQDADTLAGQQQQQGTANPLHGRFAAAAEAQWRDAIDTLFVTFAAGRAARSLRESGQARLL